ncbi:MAG: DUF2723 domain-containing protein, partial [Chloroflexi bacterium]|nr:DUF2723 domain-containing protein [Chloroflexota bacterium]
MIAAPPRQKLATLTPFLVLFGVTLAVYASTRSISYDDWDSVNFARAIAHFDIRLQQPHPPGYPAYVFLARLIDFFTKDPLAALTLLSAISGALCVVAFYGVARDLGAGWAALPLAVWPLFWLNSDMALSDVPGLAFAVMSVWLLERATIGSPLLTFRGLAWLTHRRAYLIAGCAMAGLGTGVRPQDAVVPLSVLALYVAPQLWHRDGGRRDLFIALVVFTGSCLTWGIPMAISLGPLPEALQPFRRQVGYIRLKDTLGSEDGWTLDSVRYRIAEYGQTFSAYFGGPQDGGFNAFVALSAAVALLARIAGRARATWLALVWLLPYPVVMQLVMQPDDPRKALPALPPVFLLLAAASVRFAGRSIGKGWLALGVALTAVFAVKSLPLIRTLDTTLTPPEQASSLIA